MRVTVDDGGFRGHVSESAGRFGANLTATFCGRLAGVSCVSRFRGHVSESAGRFGADLTETFCGRSAGVSCVSRFRGHVSESAGRFGADLTETFCGARRAFHACRGFVDTLASLPGVSGQT